jgi:hypothetical protein
MVIQKQYQYSVARILPETMETKLEEDNKILEDIIRVTAEVIEKQIAIKETAEKLKTENEQLQMKSRELQTILATSQKQLQLETSIPILMINKLVTEVNHIKEDQGVKINDLILSVDETSNQFGLMKRKVDSHVTPVLPKCDGTVSKLVKELLLCPIV